MKRKLFIKKNRKKPKVVKQNNKNKVNEGKIKSY
jgi:hypothetical protein